MSSNNHLPPNRALAKIREGGVVSVYVTGNFASPRHVDFVARSGYFDAIWFDLEHFDIPTQELATLCLVAKASPVTTIARLKATDYQVVMRTLETGAGGLMCSMVADAEEARRIVSWAKFNNPQPAPGEVTGQRGWNGGNIDSGYAAHPAIEYMRHQNTETMILCQIEHTQAVENAAQIAAVPGVSGLFFGPGDYSASIGLPGQIGHEEVRKAMAKVAAAARAAGKFWGTVAVGPEMYGRAIEMGAQFLCPGGDLKVMTLGLRELAKSLAGAPQRVPEPAGAKAGSTAY
ncbi:aldolase/citrate lyase family protein [Termitidicoccus mucosus]|uniref:Aldolase n=1 Tax=Termitidicoccus mucosus TaxID=1184151 RepID=A0A178IBQ0_9BACT|nr:aldolase [Opitutaceae bacterium TSB47]